MVDFSGEAPVVTDGPYGETKELFEGFFLLDSVSKQELVELPSRRAPEAAGPVSYPASTHYLGTPRTGIDMGVFPLPA